MARVDVAAIRAAHPIEEVVAASGVELRPSGRAFMARCPFHVEDRHPSMSVGGLPGRYHCFACGAGGDVIDYVARFNGIGFRDAADRLTGGAAFTGRIPTAIPLAHRTTDGPVLERTSASRIFQINELAWRYFTERPNLDHAEQYMLTERRIDLRAIRSETDGQPLVGYAPSTWRRLTDTLLREGVTPDELVDADLASRRDYRLIDAFRGRVVVPVRDSLGRIEGFIGRNITGDATAAKYRNPTKTATFDKSYALYRPTRHHLDPDGQAIVVEGVIDALAVTAAAASAGALERFAACATSGVTVSRVQAIKVVAITANPVIIVLDGDDAGAAGTTRWADMLVTQLSGQAEAVRLPAGLDPAGWLSLHGHGGLGAFRGAVPVRDVDRSIAMEVSR
jgi:DNA primase catalytic core